MRSASVEHQAALAEATVKGHAPRQLVSLSVKDRETGEVEVFNIWGGDYPLTFNVISGTTGLTVSRVYAGDVNLAVGTIKRVSNLTIPNVSVRVSGIPTLTQQLVRGYEARLAKIEIHSLLLDPVSRQPVGPAEIEYLGIVDSAPIETPAANGESAIEFTVASDSALMLTRRNARKRSDEGQRRRNGDRLHRYSNVMQTVQVAWGQELQNK